MWCSHPPLLKSHCLQSKGWLSNINLHTLLLYVQTASIIYSLPFYWCFGALLCGPLNRSDGVFEHNIWENSNKMSTSSDQWYALMTWCPLPRKTNIGTIICQSLSAVSKVKGFQTSIIGILTFESFYVMTMWRTHWGNMYHSKQPLPCALLPLFPPFHHLAASSVSPPPSPPLRCWIHLHSDSCMCTHTHLEKTHTRIHSEAHEYPYKLNANLTTYKQIRTTENDSSKPQIYQQPVATGMCKFKHSLAWM